MGALTQHCPKPLIKVNGVVLLDHALGLVPDDCTVVVNTHYLHDQIEDHLNGRDNVSTLFEPEILETGGGLKNAMPRLGDGPVITANSDAIWTGPNPIAALRDAWRPEDMDALLMLIPHQNAQEHRGVGDFDLHTDGHIERRGSAPKADYVYSGVQIIKTAGLEKIEQTAFSLNVLWDEMIRNQRAFGLVHHGGWVDVGRPEGIEVAERLLDSNV